MGNALVGRLLCSLVRQRVPIVLGAVPTGMIMERSGIEGVAVATGAGTVHLRTPHGVVLATGGFSRHPALRQVLLPEPVPDHCGFRRKSPVIPI